MADFFKKLNTLVKATVNDVLGDAPSKDPRRTSFVPGKDVDREIASLRQRINEAVDYENRLSARVTTLQNEVARLDAQADEAVQQGNEAQARYLIDQVQRARQRLRMAESDLSEHQLVTQELIQRVNMMETAVAEARRQPADTTPPPLPTRPLSEALADTREKIASMDDLLAARDEVNAALTQPEAPTSAKTIEDDLEARRQRLSKR